MPQKLEDIWKIFFFLSSSQIVPLASLTSQENHLLHQPTLGIHCLLFQVIQAQGYLLKEARTSPGDMVWVICYQSDRVLGRWFWELGFVSIFHSFTLLHCFFTFIILHNNCKEASVLIFFQYLLCFIDIVVEP